jgi:RNase P/RNase MRP subunit p30
MELLVHRPEETEANLQRRVKAAARLGHKEIVLLFTAHDPRNAAVAKTLGVTAALLVNDQNKANGLRRQYDAILAAPRRDLVECKAVTHLFNPEQQGRPDFLHHRNSGLNQVLLELCKRHGKGIVTTLAALGTQGSTLSAQTVMLGRMRQNAKWCTKYKVPYHVTSGAKTLWEQRDADGLKAFGRELLLS